MDISQQSINSQLIRLLEINPAASKVLLILHGWGGCIDSWKNFLTALEGENLRVIAFDLPGFGLSPAPTKNWQIKDYANLVKEVIDSYNLKQVYLLGHSFGGQIAVQFAHDYPQHLHKLFLVGAAAIRPKQTFFKGVIKFLVKLLKALMIDKSVKLRRFLYKAFGNLDYGKIDNPIMKQIMAAALAADLRHFLPQIKTETIIVWGREDTYTPLKHGLMIKELMPNAKMIILENARHGIHLQQPAELKKIILANVT